MFLGLLNILSQLTNLLQVFTFMQIESELWSRFLHKDSWVFISTRVPSQTISMPAMINPNQKGKENYEY